MIWPSSAANSCEASVMDRSANVLHMGDVALATTVELQRLSRL